LIPSLFLQPLNSLLQDNLIHIVCYLNKLQTATEGKKFLNVGRKSFTVLEYVPTCF
jgi:hypothetical protein